MSAPGPHFDSGGLHVRPTHQESQVPQQHFATQRHAVEQRRCTRRASLCKVREQRDGWRCMSKTIRSRASALGAQRCAARAWRFGGSFSSLTIDPQALRGHGHMAAISTTPKRERSGRRRPGNRVTHLPRAGGVGRPNIASKAESQHEICAAVHTRSHHRPARRMHAGMFSNGRGRTSSTLGCVDLAAHSSRCERKRDPMHHDSTARVSRSSLSPA